MWNSALGAWLGAWEDDAVIVGQLGEALFRCIVGTNSTLSRAFKPCCAKTLHQAVSKCRRTHLDCSQSQETPSFSFPCGSQCDECEQIAAVYRYTP